MSSIQFTFVHDGFPLVELALVGHGVEMATLDISEGGQLLGTWCGVADLVSLSLSQTILPPELRTDGSFLKNDMSVQHSPPCSFLFKSLS